MEKRAILAAVLMAAVFIVYQMFFFPESPSPQKPPAQTASQPAPAPTQAPSTPPTTAATAPARAPQAQRPLQRLATVESPLYRDVVSSEGGKLQELVLRYRGEKPMVILGDLGPAGLQLSPDGNGPGEVVSDRKSTRLNSSHSQISYAVFCLKKKNMHVRPADVYDQDLHGAPPTGTCQPPTSVVSASASAGPHVPAAFSRTGVGSSRIGWTTF